MYFPQFFRKIFLYANPQFLYLADPIFINCDLFKDRTFIYKIIFVFQNSALHGNLPKQKVRRKISTYNLLILVYMFAFHQNPQIIVVRLKCLVNWANVSIWEWLMDVLEIWMNFRIFMQFRLRNKPKANYCRKSIKRMRIIVLKTKAAHNSRNCLLLFTAA
jgi:hypothetical protein